MNHEWTTCCLDRLSFSETWHSLHHRGIFRSVPFPLICLSSRSGQHGLFVVLVSVAARTSILWTKIEVLTFVVSVGLSPQKPQTALLCFFSFTLHVSQDDSVKMTKTALAQIKYYNITTCPTDLSSKAWTLLYTAKVTVADPTEHYSTLVASPCAAYKSNYFWT